MFTPKKARAITAVAVGALALAACSGSGDEATDDNATTGASESSTAEATPTETLTLGVAAQVSTFRATDARWANESPMMQAVYDTLIRATPSNEFEPGLATEWSYDDTNTVLTLSLREGVTFSDGSTFGSEDVVATMLGFRDGTSPDAAVLADVEDVVAVDDYTVEVHLSAPNPALVQVLTQNAGIVGASESIDAADADTMPLGTGPYTFNASDTVVGDSYVFDMREDYWDPESQHYAQVVTKVLQDPTAMLNASQAGQLNVARVMDPNSVPQYEGAGWNIVTGELNWTGLLLMDRDGTMNEAMGDVRVRQAINYALDREGLVAALTAGYGTATSQIFPTGSASYNAEYDSYYEYDPERAKELLAEAGYGDGLEVAMPFTQAFGGAQIALIQQQLADVGITLTTVEVAPTEYFPAILTASQPMAFMTLQQDPTDWQLLQFQVLENAAWNPFRVANDDIAALAEDVRTGDDATAADAGAQINDILVENAWFAPFYRPENIYATDADTVMEFQTGNAYPYLSSIKPVN